MAPDFKSTNGTCCNIKGKRGERDFRMWNCGSMTSLTPECNLAEQQCWWQCLAESFYKESTHGHTTNPNKWMDGIEGILKILKMCHYGGVLHPKFPVVNTVWLFFFYLWAMDNQKWNNPLIFLFTSLQLVHLHDWGNSIHWIRYNVVQRSGKSRVDFKSFEPSPSQVSSLWCDRRVKMQVFSVHWC